jgi:hypothetical protein
LAQAARRAVLLGGGHSTLSFARISVASRGGVKTTRKGYVMGDKGGKKDKTKNQKQKVKKQEQKVKMKQDKQLARTPEEK